MFFNNNIEINSSYQQIEDKDLLDTCNHSLFMKITVRYLQGTLDVIGIIFSLLCLIIFRTILKEEESHSFVSRSLMHKYLLVKSINELYFFTSDILIFFYQCEDCRFRELFIVQIWYIYSSWFVEESSLTFSTLLEIAATFDCLIVIHNKLKFFRERKIWFYFVIIFSIFISIILQIHVIFHFKIVHKNGTFFNMTKVSIVYKIENVKKSDVYLYLLFSSLVRDWLSLFVLLLLNSLILLSIKKLVEKRRMREKSDNKNINGNLVRNSMNAEQNKAKMILVFFINFIISHSVSFYLGLPFKINQNYICYDNIRWSLLTIGNVFPFFIYFYFNKRFKKYITQLFLKLVNNNRVYHHY
jgi:hypothetical protein